MRGSLSVIAVAACLFTACTSGERQRLQLEELERMNRADSVMLNDSLARDLADWFDRHGTRNEQLRAYYMLGRTYADRGEVPQALEAYNDAADRADTTATNCDYRTLSRIYAQTAQLYCNQLLPDHMIRYEKLAMKYAMEAKDTMCYLGCFAMLGEGYELKNDTDSSLVNLLEAYQLYKGINAPELAASLCCSIANIYIQKHDYTKAAEFLHEYETCSGFFNDNGDVESVKGMYYYFKGLWCLNTSDKVNAEFFFRKLNTVALTYDQKIAAFDGLHALYQSSFNKDSLVKYSRLRDSLSYIAHNEIEMQKTLQMQAMYDYSHNEKLAHQKKEEAERLLLTLSIIVALMVILLLSFALFFLRYKSEKHLLEEKIRILRGYAVNERLFNSHVAQHFRQLLKENPYKKPDYNDWKELNSLIANEIPSFPKLMKGDKHVLSEFEYDVCLLIKIQISISSIAKLKNCTPAHITQTRKNIYKKLFKKKGRADELDEYILSLS